MSPRIEAAAGPSVLRASTLLDDALGLAVEWAGRDALAVILGGSHATREAVWIEHDGRRLTLSDLDLYAVLPDRGAVAAAERRRKQDHPMSPERLVALGLAAPLEITFTTPEGLARMVARPSSIELARSALVVSGDSGWARRLPRHDARDVSREEVLLLLENRGFELLSARTLHSSAQPLAPWRARHATLKAALDLAGVLCLLSGAYPEGAAGRVAWARGLDVLRFDVPPPWNEALAWRREPRRLAPPDAAREWHAAAEAWCAVWRHVQGTDNTDPVDTILRTAARASLRRRIRRAIGFQSRGGRAPGLLARLSAVPAGTPAHRLNGAATATLFALTGAIEVPRWESAMARLGFPAARTGLADSVRHLLVQWDHWVLDGQRTADWA